ncbi:hypothetical protein JYA35_14735 [Bacillus velezensis]|uniref:hypothetical protein n=1 Tax=Bacillus velezensis TaxID=492670 RepID=UPI0019D37D2F|nr:hypothetical protein [Bacillus velezensis]MBN7743839.1 hypothetical protein [Bacillus velezensis]
MKIDLNAMGYDELIAHGEDVMRAIRLRAYGEGYRQGKFDAEMDTTHGQAPAHKSDQARRDEIVEQAKADVEKRITNNALDRVVYFVPNRIKRTVVALIKGEYSGKVYAKGIAKAAPNDCFNVHIGKAIALRRALCLAVPDEYLNAPQPTEIRVGDVVRGKYEESYYQYEGRLFGNSYEEQIKEIEDGKFRYISGYYDFIDSADLTIIDDSREEVGGE